MCNWLKIKALTLECSDQCNEEWPYALGEKLYWPQSSSENCGQKNRFTLLGIVPGSSHP